MLVIVSDLHLKDGTSGTSITPDAFRIFAERLRNMAYRASWRTDGKYRPIETIDLVLLGDIFDLILSSRWHDTTEGDPNYVRPWHDVQSPATIAKIGEITRGALEHNAASFQILRRISRGEIISLPPATADGRPAKVSAEDRLPVKVYIHQVVGNHDWYFHLPGEGYDAIRQEVIDTLGLANPATPFPHDPTESDILMEAFRQHHVFARHGDIFDPLNYNREAGRDAATLGDAVASEMLTLFPLEVHKRLGDELPEQFSSGLKELTNVRPVLVTPLWISNLVSNYAGSQEVADEVKAIWDELGERFLDLEFVRSQDRFLKFDTVDALQNVLFISRTLSFETINKIMGWATEKFWDGKYSIADNVLEEAPFKDRSANFFVYGHTHIHETVPLDSGLVDGKVFNQVYINSGTWHSYHDLTMGVADPRKFIGMHVMTYLAFFKGDERNGHPFESWSGSLSAWP
jgi:UDP-2,3-diacylglucosamine pyrophosphatase LpxH